MHIFFIRHGEPDYSFIKPTNNCQWSNLAPLTTNGVKQALNLRNNKDLINKKIICSPYTRTLQTATLLANGKNVIIEPNLHEWLPSKNFLINVDEISIANKNFKTNCQNCDYETKQEMINRFSNVIDKYKQEKEIIIVSHSRVMSTYLQSININKKYFDYCEVFDLDL